MSHFGFGTSVGKYCECRISKNAHFILYATPTKKIKEKELPKAQGGSISI